MKTKLLLLVLSLFTSGIINAQCERQGTFAAVDDPVSYPVSGTTILTFETNGSKTLTFENDFATVQGLNLQVYLTTTLRLGQGGTELLITTQALQDNNGGMDIGDEISGFMSFTVPASVELSDYSYVIIQCINADVLWGRAPLGTLTGPDCATLSIDENTLLENVSFYPNPATNNIEISNDKQLDIEILILDLLGKVVLTTKNSSLRKQSISLTSLKTGVYLMQIKAEGNTVTKKLVKQ